MAVGALIDTRLCLAVQCSLAAMRRWFQRTCMYLVESAWKLNLYSIVDVHADWGLAIAPAPRVTVRSGLAVAVRVEWVL